MADTVRLGIVYDTSQAAASLTRLTQQLGAAQSRATQLAVVFAKANQRWATSSEIMASMAKDAGRAAAATKTLVQPIEAVTMAAGINVHAQTALKRGLVGLAMQATATSGPVGHLAQALVLMGGGGGVLIAVAAAVGVLALAYHAWTQDTRDAIKAQEELIASLQSVGAHALLTAARIKLSAAQGALVEAEAPSGVLTRMADAFRSEGQLEARRQTALRALAKAENDVAAASLRAAEAGNAQLKVIRDINEAERIRLANRAAENAQGLFLAQQGILRQASAGDRRLRGMDPRQAQLAPEIPELAGFRKSLTGILQPTREVTQAQVLFKNGLFTMTDAIEEFVVDGTFAFTNFLDNIIRLLYRDFTGNLVDQITGAVFPGTNTGPSGGGGGKDIGTIKGSVQSNVTFNVNTMDAQGVSQWLNQNGPQIAAVVGNHAARARGLRKQMGGR